MPRYYCPNCGKCELTEQNTGDMLNSVVYVCAHCGARYAPSEIPLREENSKQTFPGDPEVSSPMNDFLRRKKQ